MVNVNNMLSRGHILVDEFSRRLWNDEIFCKAIPMEGYGMIIGSEDEAFPRNPAARVVAC
jgi:hypothetical protein